MNNAIVEILNFKDLFSEDIINKSDKSTLFFVTLNKLTTVN